MKKTIPCKIAFSKADNCWYVESPGFYDGIMTYGDTLEEAKEMAKEAVHSLLESYLEHGSSFIIPKGGKGWYEVEIETGLAFALWLRNARISRGMTLADVAEEIGVKYQVYQKLENPNANPTLKTLKKLEQVFDTNLINI